MSATAGVCFNRDYCSLADRRNVVWIAVEEPFACPECAKPLRPPPPRDRAGIRFSIQAMAACGALALLAGAGYVGYLLNRAPAPATVHPAPAAAVSNPAAAAAPVAFAVTAAAPRALATSAPAPSPAGPTASQAGAAPAQAAPGVAALNVQAPGLPPTAPPPARTASAPVFSPPAPRLAGPPAAPLTAPTATPRAAAIAPPATTAPAPPAATPKVPDAPFAPRNITGGQPPYPAALASDGRTGQVSVACTILPDGTPANCRATDTRGGRLFTDSVLGWLRHGHVRYAPVIQHGTPATVSARWTVTVEEPREALLAALAAAQRAAQAASAPAATARTAAPAATAPKPAPAPVTPAPLAPPTLPAESPPAPASDTATTDSRPFTGRPLHDSTPDYPEEYGSVNRVGQVTVDCLISAAGWPKDCRLVSVVGGGAFGPVVLKWLRSGSVRYAPILANNRPVAERQQWTIKLVP